MRLLKMVSIVALLAGCGSSTPSATQACADLAAARCNKRMSCSNGVNITAVYGTMANCLTREALSCTLALAAPSTGNSPSAAEACVAAFANYSCGDFFSNNPPAACINFGSKASGAACAFNGQCASGYCNNSKTSNCGTCGAAPTVGSSCLNSNCARQQSCAARVEMCVTLGGASAPCDNNSQPCGPDLACVGNTGGAMGMCVAGSATMGATCGGANPPCDGTMGLACIGPAGSKTCQPYTQAADGMPCGALSTGFTSCASGGECFTATGLTLSGQTGTCKAAAADGQACDIVTGPPCLAPARCVVSTGSTAGTCTLPNGATCG